MTAQEWLPSVLPKPPEHLAALETIAVGENLTRQDPAAADDTIAGQVTAKHQEFLTTMTEVHARFVHTQRTLARAVGEQSTPAPATPTFTSASPIRSLAFVVTTGRSGSTALSNILNGHPEVLSLNEFFLSVRTQLPTEGLVSAERFWRTLADPHPLFDPLVRGGAAMPEFLYPDLPRTRFDSDSTGIPALAMMTLPHLTDTPDDVFDALAEDIATWPAQTTAEHFRALFAWLATRFGRTVAIERSGLSLGAVPWLRTCFPEAKFVHLHRNGPDTAVSMSKHTGFRLLALIVEAMELLDLDERDSRRAWQLDPSTLPVELAPLLGERYDRDYLMSLDLPVTRFALMWAQLIELGEDALADLPRDRKLTLSYEDLLADPHGRLSELAAFLDIQRHPTWLETSAASLDPGRAGASKRLAPNELRAVQELCAPGTDRLRT